MGISASVKAASGPANTQVDGGTVSLLSQGSSASLSGNSIGAASNGSIKMVVTSGSAGAIVTVDSNAAVNMTANVQQTFYGATIYARDTADGSSGGHGAPPPPTN